MDVSIDGRRRQPGHRAAGLRDRLDRNDHMVAKSYRHDAIAQVPDHRAAATAIIGGHIAQRRLFHGTPAARAQERRSDERASSYT